jgi:hypothetical protein
LFIKESYRQAWGNQNLADAGFEFLRWFQVPNEKLPAADEIFAPTKVLPPSLPSCPPAILSEWTIWVKFEWEWLMRH